MEEAKKSYQKSGEEENTDSNDEMGFLPFQRITELVIAIDGRKFKKVLNLDEETIKVLRLMGEKYENIICEKNGAECGFYFTYIDIEFLK